MNIQTKIGNGVIVISEPMIQDVYNIEQNEETKMFYIWSENGYYSKNMSEFKTINLAIKRVKVFIKDYFVDRCEENPKGW